MSEKQQKKSSNTKTLALGAIVLLLLVGGGYVLFENSHTLITGQNEGASSQIKRLEAKIDALENKMNNLKENNNLKELAALNEKIEEKSKSTGEILDSKASVSALMGAIERLDRLETSVKNLGQVTSQNALILTAAALTQEAAKSSRPFVYEASVLEELSKGTSVQKSAEIIASFAEKGLPLREDLIEKFTTLYEENFLKKVEQTTDSQNIQTAQDWKDKTIQKLKNLVVIEKTNAKSEEGSELLADEVYRLVREGDFDAAMLKMEKDQKYQTEDFEIWKEQVRSEKTFNQEMNKIKALTLGAMKTESLKQAD